MDEAIKSPTTLSLVHAMPLSNEQGIGALSLPAYLREICERYADNEALVMYKGDQIERWSYKNLWDRSTEVAKALVANGVTKGTRVGILMTNRSEYLSALFGTAMAGGVSVVLSTFSTAAEMDYLLGISSLSILLLEDRVLKKDFVAMLSELEPQILTANPGAINSKKYPFLTQIVALEGITAVGKATTTTAIENWNTFLQSGATICDETIKARSALVHPCDDGALFFSSGTTSLPKGILHAQRSFTIQFWRWPRLWDLKEPARCWTGNGFFWSGPVTIIVGTALSTGGAIIMQPLFDAEQALKLIEAEKVTLMNGRPHQWARMQSSPGWESADLSSLKQITKGDIILEHPTVNTDWTLPNAFGTTETMAILASFVAGDAANENPRNFGLLLPGNIIKIIDPISGEIVPMGELGEVCIKGPTLMKGYLGKSPEEVFDNDGFYRTGDGAYIDEQGHVFWEGRLNDIIKTGGANVSPQEIDTVIATYPGVKRTQTVGVPDDLLSERVVACIVPVENVSLNVAKLNAFIKKRLASFKVPRNILFFTEEEYPLTGNEKVKAGDLKKLACERLGVKV